MRGGARKYAASFGSGPTMLPASVLEQVRADVLDFAGTGLSILEIPQSNAAAIAVYEQAEADVRELLDVPADYRVLFLHAGASTHFAMVPLNLLRGHSAADYVHTGLWSSKAIDQARAYAEVRVVGDAAPTGFARVPEPAGLVPTAGSAYVHYTYCDSVQGLEFPAAPSTGDTPLVCDATASLFARPVPIERHALVYASTQKNLGATGMTLVIVHESMLGQPLPTVPLSLDYTHQAACGSRFTTPPMFAWYLAGRMLAWIRSLGGVKILADHVLRRSQRLYAAIDGSGFYHSPVDPGSRSRTSIPFVPANPELTGVFVEEARAAGMVGLAGHTSVGGLRAGLFAATPDPAVDGLIAFMSDFERRYG
ncbi:MAG: 3-phosphoserine/phosphohydroxythreonine transaminase [Pseudonocardiaceae bacterium]